jgi:hypothetical protein
MTSRLLAFCCERKRSNAHPSPAGRTPDRRGPHRRPLDVPFADGRAQNICTERRPTPLPNRAKSPGIRTPITSSAFLPK